MSKILTLLIAVIPLVLPVAFESAAAAQSSAAWQLIWSDEFNGPVGLAPNPSVLDLAAGTANRRTTQKLDM